MPWPGNRVQTGYTANNFATVDAETEKCAAIFQASETGSLDYVWLRVRNITTTPGANVDIRVETVDTSTGNPTGTLFGANTNYSWDMSGASAYSPNRVGPFTSSPSLTRGSDYFAIVYVPPASPDQGSVDFGGFVDEPYGFPYSRFYNGSSWSSTGSLVRWQIALEYSTGLIAVPGAINTIRAGTLSRSTLDSTDHYGPKMKSRENLEVVGMYGCVDADADFSFKLIQGDSTVLGTISINSTYRPLNQTLWHYGFFSSPITVTKDTFYRYVTAPATTTDIQTGGLRSYYPGDGKNYPTLPCGFENEIFYDVANENGEPTTPTWSVPGEGAMNSAWPLVGPIVRSIG